MKKRIALLLSMVLAASIAIAGCSPIVAIKGEENDGTQSGNTQTEVAEGSLKTGLAVMTSVSSSADAAQEDGSAVADVSIAAVTVDADGKIVACTIDGAQTKVSFDATGKITTDLASEFKTKQELGEAYGMKVASAIGKEWNEQADAFAQYCIGKTADEVTGIAVTEQGTADGDLASSCSLYIGGFQAIVVKAVENAVESNANAGDKIGLGVVTSVANSKDATAEEAGVVEAYSTITAVTVDAEGKITSAAIDAVQATVNFDTTGKITSDLTAPISTKNELGADYGMKVASSIGKEWNEQANAYALYAVGKTVDEVNNTAVTEGVPSDADLAASVTIRIGDFNAVITKAAANAK